MSIIRVLPAEIVGRIAAGEVIERPASVVKELVENAIDAGATRIRVNAEQGGQRMIQVIDNGCGMDRDDALLCLETHATSKITRDGDVGQIHTLGFRGEALPSIASVSRAPRISVAKSLGSLRNPISIRGAWPGWVEARPSWPREAGRSTQTWAEKPSARCNLRMC